MLLFVVDTHGSQRMKPAPNVAHRRALQTSLLPKTQHEGRFLYPNCSINDAHTMKLCVGLA